MNRRTRDRIQELIIIIAVLIGILLVGWVFSGGGNLVPPF